MELFELQGKLILDPGKETILFVDKGDQEEYTNTYGTARFIKERLREKYNIVTIGTGCNLTDNYFDFKAGFGDGLLRKAEDPDYIKKNLKTINASLSKTFKKLPAVQNIILGTDFGYRLPSTGYCSTKVSEELCNLKHEFFDYIGDDKEHIKLIESVEDNVVKNWFKLVSPFAFSTKVSSYFNYLIKFLNDQGKIKNNVIAFIIDPAFPVFYYKKNNIPIKPCYFETDKRGTRDFVKFPISQFQHLLYDKHFNHDSLDDWGIETPVEKTHNMFFGGTIFHETGFRATVWPTFLKDIKSPKCNYFIPLVKNNFTKSTKKHIDSLEENQKELLDSVTNHPNYKPGVTSLELYKEIAKYKYGIVFRCVSTFNSLNFKPVFYVSEGILPFLDEQYDPDFLQIPEEIQCELLVRNSKDIDEKIKYFNKNEDHRLALLDQLRKLFKIDDFVNNTNDIISTEINKLLG